GPRGPPPSAGFLSPLPKGLKSPGERVKLCRVFRTSAVQGLYPAVVPRIYDLRLLIDEHLGKRCRRCALPPHYKNPPPHVGGYGLFSARALISIRSMKKILAFLFPIFLASTCIAQETTLQKPAVKNPAITPVTRGNPTNWMAR